ncbi:MAG: hypothetical protein FWE62_05630 [Firmicutes bacterium]|nr:hypothetical protein [Bacillota bacterium]
MFFDFFDVGNSELLPRQKSEKQPKRPAKIKNPSGGGNFEPFLVVFRIPGKAHSLLCSLPAIQ